MGPARFRFSTEFHGNSSEGHQFDDRSIIKDVNNTVLTKIVLYHDQFIDSLTMHYTGSCTPVTRGSSAGTRTEIVLGPGEFITTVKGLFYGNKFAQLLFTTNKGVDFGPYGGNKNNSTSQFAWNAGDNSPTVLAGRIGLLYFTGRADSYIRQLRATFAVYPIATKASTTVKFERLVPTEPATCGVDLSSFARNMMSPVVALHVGPDPIVFHAYEDTLCRIPFFRAALQGQFQEAIEKKITIPEEKPEIISALIEYICTSNYTYTYADDTATDLNGAPTPDLTQGCFHVHVYAVASMYDCPSLVSNALHNFVEVLSQLDGMDIVRLWQAAYEKGLTLPLCAEAGLIAEFTMIMPKLLKGLYKTDGEGMDKMVAEFPALASDIMRFLVSD